MGQLVDGTWKTGDLAPTKDGAFARQATVFRGRITDVEAGRYHLYVSRACPWAHRTLITRALRGLEHALGVTVVDPHMDENGWPFRTDDPDPFGPSTYLRDVYLRADAKYTGRVTVPVLWDTQRKTIVNNESREVMRILDVDFAPLSRDAVIETLAPADLLPAIERTLDAIYEPINNGVYRAGFAKTQAAYDDAVRTLFSALAEQDAVLLEQPFLCGDRMTEADIALFTTLLRFDLVYYSHFKCNLRRIRDHAGLWRFARRMYAVPAIRATCALDEIKTHYYWSQDNVNPSRIVPLGPDDYATDLEAAL